MQISDWIRASAALGTWAAVMVALFGLGPRFWRWITRPKLQVVAENAPPRCLMVPWAKPDGTPLGHVYYLRLWVENNGGVAEDVEVLAHRCWEKLGDGSFQLRKSFHPLSLAWAYSGEAFTKRISPSMGRHCDFARVFDPMIRGTVGRNSDLPAFDPHRPLLELCVEKPPYSRPHLLGPGTYRVELLIAAANSKPVSQVVEVTLIRWDADEEQMRAHGVRMTLSSAP